jgi:HD-like signal output (HDOD) protein
MFGWLSSLRRAPMPAAATAAPAAVPAALLAPSALAYLLDGPPPQPGPLTDAERELLRPLDRQLTATTLPADLLPRAPAVIPQLLGLLRQEQPSRAAMVQQVLKDMLLTAEVLRLARSPFYGAQPVDRLEAALDRIGTAGLQSAMARVLLKPVFQARAGGLVAQAAPRLWAHAEYKSMLCAELVAQDGGDRFEGLLAGLLHDTGWMALLRVMERTRVLPVLPVSLALDAALDRRKDRLFGRLTADWDLTPALTSLSRQLRGTAPGACQEVDLRLVTALREADRHCTADLSGQPRAS